MKKLLGFLLGFILIASTTFSGSMTSVTNPGGADTQVQFNNAGAFGGDSDMTFVSGTTLNLDILNLPTSSATEGYLTINGTKFLHSAGGSPINFFGGAGAGNATATTSINNVGIGNNALDAITTSALGNVGIGSDAMGGVTTGDYNFGFGGEACVQVTTGGSNVCIGNSSGSGSGNVSQRFIVDVTSDTTPFLYGEFDTERLCIECNAPTARFHLPAGTATAGYAPLKFTSGTNLTTPEAGAIEYNGTELFFSPSTVRHTVVKSAAASATPTVTGFGTSPSVVTSNGTHAFTINVGTGGTASTGTITLPTATTAWVCNMWDVTNPDSFNTKMTGGTATTVTVTNYSMTTGNAIAWTASDILRVSCIAY